MGRASCACLVVASGCAQLFGIDNTTGGGVDAPPGVVTAQVQRITVGPTMARTPEDVTHLTASWLVPDASSTWGMRRVTADAASDTWSAMIPDGNPPFEFTMAADYPDSFRRLYVFPQRNIKILYGVAEQPNAQPAPPGGAFSVTVNLPSGLAAGEGFQMNGIGAWANHGFGGAELPAAGGTTIGPVTIPYNATTWGSSSGRPLTAVTKSDTILALRYVNNYELSGAAEFPAFDQTGGTDTITTTMTNNPRAALDVHVDPMAIGSRLAMPAPAGITLSMAWSVVAAPGYMIANNGGPLLNYGTIAMPTDPGAVTAPYGNPFTSKDWRSTFTWSSNKSRTYAVPALNNQTATLYTGINELAEVAAGLTLDTPAPLPTQVSINAIPLTTDGQVIQLDPMKAVDLAMTTDGSGTALFYQWNIYELKPNANGTTLDAHVVYAALATDTHITIPNDVFVTGKVYQMRGHAIGGGYPGFAQGDLTQRSLPYTVAYLDAGIFTVTAP